MVGPGTNSRSYTASQNVEESKKIGVFMQEYRINNIQIIDTNYTFPIESAWMELGWYEDLTKPVRQIRPIIDSTARSKIVFGLKKTSNFFLI